MFSCFVWCELFVSRLGKGAASWKMRALRVRKMRDEKVLKVFAVDSFLYQKEIQTLGFLSFHAPYMKVIGIIYIHTYFDRQGIDK